MKNFFKFFLIAAVVLPVATILGACNFNVNGNVDNGPSPADLLANDTPQITLNYSNASVGDITISSKKTEVTIQGSGNLNMSIKVAPRNTDLTIFLSNTHIVGRAGKPAIDASSMLGASKLFININEDCSIIGGAGNTGAVGNEGGKGFAGIDCGSTGKLNFIGEGSIEILGGVGGVGGAGNAESGKAPAVRGGFVGGMGGAAIICGSFNTDEFIGVATLQGGQGGTGGKGGKPPYKVWLAPPAGQLDGGKGGNGGVGGYGLESKNEPVTIDNVIILASIGGGAGAGGSAMDASTGKKGNPGSAGAGKLAGVWFDTTRNAEDFI
jgi:hypothetical protein